jgi:hypothetical protein
MTLPIPKEISRPPHGFIEGFQRPPRSLRLRGEVFSQSHRDRVTSLQGFG